MKSSVKKTGQPIDVIARDTDRDNFMSAEEALEYGLIDQNRQFQIRGINMSNEKRWKSKQVCCSFCGKSQSQVKRMVAGPGVYICDECVALCEEIIANDFVPKEIDFEKCADAS